MKTINAFNCSATPFLQKSYKKIRVSVKVKRTSVDFAFIGYTDFPPEISKFRETTNVNFSRATANLHSPFISCISRKWRA